MEPRIPERAKHALAALLQAEARYSLCRAALGDGNRDYEVAKRTTDGIAMLAAAEAMIEGAQRAATAGELQEHRRYEFERLALQKLEELRPGIPVAPQWHEAVLDWYAALRIAAPEVLTSAAAEAAGSPLPTDGSDVDRLIAALQATVATTDAMREALANADSQAAWPPAPHAAALQRLELSARQLVRVVDHTRIRLSVPAEVGDHLRWWTVPSGSTLRAEYAPQNPSDDRFGSPPLAPGTYDIVVAQNDPSVARWYPAANYVRRGVHVEAGSNIEIALKSGVQIALGDAFGEPRWFVVPHDAGATAIVAERPGNSNAPFLLPPGYYDLYCLQDESEAMLFAVGVQTTADVLTAVHATSGVRLDVAGWVLPRDRYTGWWAAVPAGVLVAKARAVWTNSLPALLLPPGQYDVYWIEDKAHETAPLRLASVDVTQDAVTPVSAHSGIRLDLGDWVPELDRYTGWWGVTRPNDSTDIRVNWTNSGTALLLPPGQYDVYRTQDSDHLPLLLASVVEVGEEAVATVSGHSGIRLDLADWVPARDRYTGWWGVTMPGDRAETRIAWTNSSTALLLPPGQYDVYWVQDDEHLGHPLLLASGVDVHEGAATTVTGNSGLVLEIAAETPRLDPYSGWWGAAPVGGQPDARLHWSLGDGDQPLLLPPGTYDVYWHRDSNTPPQKIHENVTVAGGQLLRLSTDTIARRPA